MRHQRPTTISPLHVEWARYLSTTEHREFRVGRCGRWHAAYFGPWNVGVFFTEQAANEWGNLIKRSMK